MELTSGKVAVVTGAASAGTGIGLALVHGLVTRMGGRIEAGPAAEGGARFTVSLPLSPGPDATQPLQR